MVTTNIRSYKDLIVWQRSIELVTAIYELTRSFPKEKMYGLTSQIKKSAVSIPSNIAEGRMRRGQKDFAHFLSIAYASGAELETQIEIAKTLALAGGNNFKRVESLLTEVMKMLNVFIRKIGAKKAPKKPAKSTLAPSH